MMKGAFFGAFSCVFEEILWDPMLIENLLNKFLQNRYYLIQTNMRYKNSEKILLYHAPNEKYYISTFIRKLES